MLLNEILPVLLKLKSFELLLAPDKMTFEAAFRYVELPEVFVD